MFAAVDAAEGETSRRPLSLFFSFFLSLSLLSVGLGGSGTERLGGGNRGPGKAKRGEEILVSEERTRA